MKETDIIFLIGIVVGLIAGYGVGHLRGQCAGIAWCTKRLDEKMPS